MQIQRLLGQYLEANVYVLTNDKNESLIIDSGATVQDVKSAVGSSKVVAILLTHGHYDHSAFANEYAKFFDCPIYASNHIKQTMTDGEAIYSEDHSTINDFSRFVFIEDDQKLKLGGFEIDCFYTPGHSVCCECYLIENNLFAGDVLFNGGIGRTDLKFSSKKQMISSLNKLGSVKFETAFSGHGEQSDYDFQMKNIKIFTKFLTR